MEVWGWSAIVGLLALDVRGLGRVLLGEPVIVGLIVGALVGDLSTGLIIGSGFQLLWVHLLPEGAVTPPDGAVPTAVAVITVVTLAPVVAIPSHALVMLVTAISIPLGLISRWMDVHLKQWHGRLGEWADVYAHHGETGKIRRTLWLALAVSWAKAALLTGLTASLGIGLLPKIIPTLPRQMVEGFGLAYWFILPLGLAVVMELFHITKRYQVFLVSFFIISLGYGMLPWARPVWLTAGLAIALVWSRATARLSKAAY